jgi:lipopolysaccharide transport system ATP-binding protein
MRPAIRVDNLSKQYRIGTRQRGAIPDLRETITDGVKGMWRRLRCGARNGAGATEATFWALKDVSFEVQPGEVVGIIGRNGAGKSTLLKILSRIVEPTSGRAVTRGRLGSLLEVGTGFHPELTGRENVYLNGSILGMSRKEIDRKFDEIVAFSEIEKFLDTPVKRYSSGMYVRLAFAVAAHLEMEMLMIDEVLAVGDASFQKRCLKKIGSVAKSGRTVLLVSHNIAAVNSLCERCVWLSDGRVRAVGPSRAIVAQYTESDRGTVSARRWEDADAPAGNGVKLRYAAVTPCEPDAGETITVRTPIRVEFEFETTLDAAQLHFSVFLEELERGCIFNTGSTPLTCPRGRLRGSFVISGDFLNDGAYTIRMMLIKDGLVPLFDESNLLMFQVHDVEREGLWYGRVAGAVRPKLTWAVSAVPDDGATAKMGAL